MALIVGIDHVQLAMPAGGEERARAFYGELLGLAEVEKPEPLASRGGCWFQTSGTIIHLGVVEGDFVPARKAHPAFLVTELARIRQLLGGAGVEVVADEALADVERFYAADPFGNRLEFIQDGDGFSQREGLDDVDDPGHVRRHVTPSAESGVSSSKRAS